MFIIKKIVSSFVLPPGLFVTVLLALSVWTFWRGPRRSLGYLLPVAGLIWLASIGHVADALIRPLETAYPIPENPRGDVIIVLGGGVYGGAPDLSGTGSPGPGTMERMVTAARLHRRMNVPIIISGGRVHPDLPPVSQSTKRFLVDLGVNADQVIEEDQSKDTMGNARYSKEICAEYGFTQPIMVTTASHMRRSVRCFERVGLAVTPFPCALTTWPGKETPWYSLKPSVFALEKTAAALHEWLGLLFYNMTYFRQSQ